MSNGKFAAPLQLFCHKFFNNNEKSYGLLEINKSELVYTDNETKKRKWPLHHIKRYGYTNDKKVLEEKVCIPSLQKTP